MVKILLLALFTSAKSTLGGDDAASMVQVRGRSPFEDAAFRPRVKLVSPRKATDGLAPVAQTVHEKSNRGRRHEQRDYLEDSWVASFAGQEALERQWIANNSEPSPGIMRMLSRNSAKSASNSQDSNRACHTTIWIPAIERSGSTLLMDMLSIPVTFDNTNRPASPEGKFVLFEPCHEGDWAYGHDWHNHTDKASVCAEMIEDIALCNFTRIAHLWGWNQFQSAGLPQTYSKQRAANSCRSADWVIFKTVFHPLDIQPFVMPRLEHVPALRAIVNVRDPRSCYASQFRVFGRSNVISWGGNLTKICQYYAGLTQEPSHPHLMVVKFEDMIRNPHDTMQNMYSFLNVPFGATQEAWIETRFGRNAHITPNCTRNGMLPAQYTTCKREVEEVINKWRHELMESDLADWSSRACRAVAEQFNY